MRSHLKRDLGYELIVFMQRSPSVYLSPGSLNTLKVGELPVKITATEREARMAMAYIVWLERGETKSGLLDDDRRTGYIMWCKTGVCVIRIILSRNSFSSIFRSSLVIN